MVHLPDQHAGVTAGYSVSLRLAEPAGLVGPVQLWPVALLQLLVVPGLLLDTSVRGCAPLLLLLVGLQDGLQVLLLL